MDRSTQTLFNAQIQQQACEWFVEFRTGEPDEAARKSFNAWLEESPQHMGAYLQITALWNESAAVDRNEKWAFETLVAEAISDPDNVVTLKEKELMLPSAGERGRREGPEGLPGQPGAGSSRGARYLLAASVLLTVAGALTWFATQRNSYFAAVGEQRSIALPDGSTVELNSRSRIRVRYSAQERAVELQEGQALFEVARNPSRPFIVTSGKTRVRAVGTRFDVYQKVSGTVVTVIEGRVAVRDEASVGRERRDGDDSPLHVGDATEARRNGDVAGLKAPGAAGSEVFLSAGEQLRIASNIVSHPSPADIARATAWTQRQLVFDSTPLEEVTEEFNRYNTRQLIIHSPALSQFQIDGVFASTDPASLIRFLHVRPDIQVTETETEIVISQK